MLPPGTKIGRYEIQRKLARGGMGTVYVAHDPVLRRMVAVKVFVGDLDFADAAERFSREARAAASLNHTNIVTIYDFGEVGSQPYIVMEYIQGDTITEIIRRRTAVPVSEKLRWLEELCAGAASAHKMDVVHRDIKPSNLMIDRSGRLKVLDFGIAKIVNSLAKSVTAVIGTPGYMAPEQLLGQPVDARTDIFAIGVVSFELLTYEEAFQGDSYTAITHRIINEDVRRVSDLVPDAPPDLCAIVEKSLQRNPADRYQDAESLRIALSRVRRKIENTTDFDLASAQTIVVPITVPGRKVVTGTSKKPGSVGARTAELTPPPDPVAEQETLARARHAKIQGALQRSEACLQNGEFQRALDASQEVLDIEPAHAGAMALQQRITTAVAKQQAAALLAEARGEFERGALTRCKTLLDEAHHLDPSTHDAKLERDLRLARVEQERKRHRIETVNRTVAVARAALERKDVEAALALAREALSLDPNDPEARDIELTALRALEEGDGSQPTVSASIDVGADEKTTVVTLPRPTPPPPSHGDDETTVVALPWRTPPPTSTPVTPARQGVPPLPAGPSPVLPSRLPSTPAATSAPRSAPTPAVPPPAGPAPAAASPRGATAPASTSPTPVSHAPAAPPASARPATPTPTPNPLATLLTRMRALPVRAWIDAARSAVSQLLAQARAIPRTQLLVFAGIVALVLLVVAALALSRPGTRGVAQPGLMVIEALPWAHVTAIKGTDGANHLAAPAVTPLSMALPAGKYDVELSSPTSPADRRTITIDVAAGGVTVAPAARFTPPTSEEYFNRYFGGDTPTVSEPDSGAGTTAPEGTPAATPPGETSPASAQPQRQPGATP